MLMTSPPDDVLVWLLLSGDLHFIWESEAGETLACHEEHHLSSEDLLSPLMNSSHDAGPSVRLIVWSKKHRKKQEHRLLMTIGMRCALHQLYVIISPLIVLPRRLSEAVLRFVRVYPSSRVFGSRLMPLFFSWLLVS